MLKFFQLMLPVTLLQRGPDTLPYSSTLFVSAVLASLTLSLITAALMGQPVPDMAQAYLVSAGFFVASVSLLLYLQRLQARTLQTLTAVFGVSAVFALVDIVLLLAGEVGLGQTPRAFLLLLLMLWSLVVDGYILSVALDVSLLIGCLLSLAIFIPQATLLSAFGTGVP